MRARPPAAMDPSSDIEETPDDAVTELTVVTLYCDLVPWEFGASKRLVEIAEKVREYDVLLLSGLCSARLRGYAGRLLDLLPHRHVCDGSDAHGLLLCSRYEMCEGSVHVYAGEPWLQPRAVLGSYVRLPGVDYEIGVAVTNMWSSHGMADKHKAAQWDRCGELVRYMRGPDAAREAAACVDPNERAALADKYKAAHVLGGEFCLIEDKSYRLLRDGLAMQCAMEDRHGTHQPRDLEDIHLFTSLVVVEARELQLASNPLRCGIGARLLV